jgi:inosine-uridine nucleoside N-ribohydrolase
MKTPVILDTDIGGDIDDTWALALLLKSPELDVRLVTTATADTEYRARVTARLLEVAGRTDIPIGVGLRQKSDGPRERQRPWIEDYALARYPGRVHEDGIQAMIDTVREAPTPVTLIGIGPLTNIAEALRREPGLAGRAHFVGIHGSFHQGHESNQYLRVLEGQIAEYNVIKDLAAAQAVFRAQWLSATITPLDTCAHVVFDGARYQRLLQSADPLLRAVFDNFRIWAKGLGQSQPEVHSSVLYDTVAVYLAFATRYMRMERFGMRIDDEGFMRREAGAPAVNAAMAWQDLDAFLDFLMLRLLGPVAPVGTGGQIGSVAKERKVKK